MKFITPALINNTKKSGFFKRLFVGQKAQEAYYSAEHKTQNVKLLWMEASRFGKLNTFPCALEEEDGALVFRAANRKEDAEENAMLVKRWGLFVTPENVNEEYVVEELSAGEFNRIFTDYRMSESKLTAAQDDAAEPVPEQDDEA